MELRLYQAGQIMRSYPIRCAGKSVSVSRLMEGNGSRQKKNYLEEVYNRYFLNKRFIRSEIEAKNPAFGDRSSIEAIWLVVANRE